MADDEEEDLVALKQALLDSMKQRQREKQQQHQPSPPASFPPAPVPVVEGLQALQTFAVRMQMQDGLNHQMQFHGQDSFNVQSSFTEQLQPHHNQGGPNVQTSFTEQLQQTHRNQGGANVQPSFTEQLLQPRHNQGQHSLPHYRGRGRGARSRGGRGWGRGRGDGSNRGGSSPHMSGTSAPATAPGNLIVIQTVPMEGEQEQPRVTVPSRQPSKPFLARPQDKWAGDGTAGRSTAHVEAKPKVSNKFTRFESDSDDDSDDDDDDDDDVIDDIESNHNSDKEEDSLIVYEDSADKVEQTGLGDHDKSASDRSRSVSPVCDHDKSASDRSRSVSPVASSLRSRSSTPSHSPTKSRSPSSNKSSRASSVQSRTSPAHSSPSSPVKVASSRSSSPAASCSPAISRSSSPAQSESSVASSSSVSLKVSSHPTSRESSPQSASSAPRHSPSPLKDVSPQRKPSRNSPSSIHQRSKSVTPPPKIRKELSLSSRGHYTTSICARLPAPGYEKARSGSPPRVSNNTKLRSGSPSPTPFPSKRHRSRSPGVPYPRRYSRSPSPRSQHSVRLRSRSPSRQWPRSRSPAPYHAKARSRSPSPRAHGAPFRSRSPNVYPRQWPVSPNPHMHALRRSRSRSLSPRISQRRFPSPRRSPSPRGYRGRSRSPPRGGGGYKPLRSRSKSWSPPPKNVLYNQRARSRSPYSSTLPYASKAQPLSPRQRQRHRSRSPSPRSFNRPVSPRYQSLSPLHRQWSRSPKRDTSPRRQLRERPPSPPRMPKQLYQPLMPSGSRHSPPRPPLSMLSGSRHSPPRPPLSMLSGSRHSPPRPPLSMPYSQQHSPGPRSLSPRPRSPSELFQNRGARYQTSEIGSRTSYPKHERQDIGARSRGGVIRRDHQERQGGERSRGGLERVRPRGTNAQYDKGTAHVEKLDVRRNKFETNKVKISEGNNTRSSLKSNKKPSSHEEKIESKPSKSSSDEKVGIRSTKYSEREISDSDSGSENSKLPFQQLSDEDEDSDTAPWRDKRATERNQADIDKDRRRLENTAREKRRQEREQERIKEQEKKAAMWEERNRQRESRTRPPHNSSERPKQDARSHRRSPPLVKSESVKQLRSRSPSPTLRSALGMVRTSKSSPSLKEERGRRDAEVHQKQQSEPKVRQPGKMDVQRKELDQEEDARKIIQRLKKMHRGSGDQDEKPVMSHTKPHKKKKAKRDRRSQSPQEKPVKITIRRIEAPPTSELQPSTHQPSTRIPVHQRLNKAVPVATESGDSKRKKKIEKPTRKILVYEEPETPPPVPELMAQVPVMSLGKIDLRSVLGRKELPVGLANSHKEHKEKRKMVSEELEPQPGSKKRIKLNRRRGIMSVVTQVGSSGMDAGNEDVLDYKIQQIQEKNAEILERQREVEADRQRFG